MERELGLERAEGGGGGEIEQTGMDVVGGKGDLSSDWF